MNARTLLLTITVITLIAFPFAASAQQGPGDCDGTGPHGPKMMGGPGGPGGAEGHGLLRMLPRIADKIGLSDTQQDQIQAIVDAQAPALEALRDQAAANRDAFRDSHDIGDFNETEYREHFETQAQLHVEMQLLGAATVAQVWDVLTPEQQQQVLDLLELMGPGHRGGTRFGGGKRLGQ